MKHATSRFMFAYWDAVRGERAAPERKHIEPSRLREIIADTFILAAEPDGSTTFRLVGTRMSALFGRGLTGKRFDSLWPQDRRHEAESLQEIVGSDTTGIVAGLSGRSEHGADIRLELLMLPLRHDGATRSRFLGTVSPHVTPSWAGLVPIVDLEVSSLRVIQTAPERPAPARPSLSPRERREQFTLLQGGLSS
jgi:hypothetical protein